MAADHSGFNLRAWTYRGNKLAHPVTILRRAIALPFLWLAKGLLFAACLAGWGWDDATHHWKQLP